MCWIEISSKIKFLNTYRIKYLKFLLIDNHFALLFLLFSFHPFFCICHGFTTTGKYRSSPPEGFLEKGTLKACSKVTREHPRQSVISIKLQSIFIEITLRYECSFIFRTSFHEKISGGLLLKISICLAFNELRNLIVNKTEALIHFMSSLSSHTPWKHQKTRSCLMFSGV